MVDENVDPAELRVALGFPALGVWGSGCPAGVGWVGPALGVGPAGHQIFLPGEYKTTFTGDESKHGPEYPAQGGAKISGDRPRDFETCGLATCSPEQGVPAQGILGSNATCATNTPTESQGWQSVPHHQLAATGDPLSRRQRRNSAKKQ